MMKTWSNVEDELIFRLDFDLFENHRINYTLFIHKIVIVEKFKVTAGFNNIFHGHWDCSEGSWLE